MTNHGNLSELKQEINQIRATLGGIGALAATVLCLGAIFYHHVEGLKWLDAFYFCTITLATVGYGDIVPTTDAGKLFAIFYVIIGVGIIGAFANQLFRLAATRRDLNQKVRKDRREDRKTTES